MSVLNKFKGRKPALAAFSIGVALLLSLIAIPVVSVFASQSDDIDDAFHQLALYHAEINSRGALESELADIRARASTEPGLIKSDSAALAEAQIQSVMKDIVANNQGEVSSAQPLGSTRQGGFEEISVAYDIVVPLARLRSLVYAIESHAPYFFIDDAELTAGQAWDTGELAPAGNIPKLEVRWTIHAYRWSEIQ